MKSMKIGLFFVNAQSGPMSTPPLGPHALSAYLIENGYDASGHNLHLGKAYSSPFKLLDTISNNPGRIKAFESDAKSFLLGPDFLQNRRVFALNIELWINILRQKKFDIFGFTLYSVNLDLTLALVARIHQEFPGAKVIFGGPEITLSNAKLFLRDNLASHVVVGEGEEALLDIIQSIEENRPINAPGSFSLIDGEISRGRPAPPAYDMAELPPANFDHLPAAFKEKGVAPIEFNR